jgi:hypothetical protein
MPIVFSVPYLYQAVVDRFATDEVSIPQSFGWRAPGKREPAGTRIVWVPGDPKGSLGKIVPPRKVAGPGNATGNPRALANLDELFYVEITSGDEKDPENELAQYNEVRRIFDLWYAAVFRAAEGNLTVQSADWMNKLNLRRHGAGLKVVCSFLAVIPDKKQTALPANAVKARLELKQGEGDGEHVEILTIPDSTEEPFP